MRHGQLDYASGKTSERALRYNLVQQARQTSWSNWRNFY